MSEPYLEAISNASACIQRVYEALDAHTHLIVTADHGGQERSHGYDTPECMTIPIIMPCPLTSLTLPMDANFSRI